MKLLYNLGLLVLGFMLFSGSCKKKGEISLFNPPNKLPEATQEGKNTFGFLLNGEVWVPRGGLLDLKLDLSYDPTYNGGALSIIANRIVSDEGKKFLSIGGTGISKVGVYNFTSSIKHVNYYDEKIGCNYNDNTTISGSITITRLDLTAKIISGTFNFKLEKEGCPAINATEGRFDLRIE